MTVSKYSMSWVTNSLSAVRCRLRGHDACAQTVASIVAWVVSVSAACTRCFERKTVEDVIRVTRITRTADGTSGDTFVMSSICTCNKVWSHVLHAYAHDSQVLEDSRRQNLDY